MSATAVTLHYMQYSLPDVVWVVPQ